MYPQKKEAGTAASKAIAVIMPISTSDPPIADDTTYSGMKTESRPNAISWKKNPNRHIARGALQTSIKTFSQESNCCARNSFRRQNFFINPYEEARGDVSRIILFFIL